jgi:uncharacterized protein YfiM (DUF2279 family)
MEPLNMQTGRKLRHAPWLAALVTVFAASGANCNQWVRSYTQPRTLPEAATVEQIVNVINSNSAKVQSLQASSATLSAAGAPMSLRAEIAVQTPRRLRLQASGSLTGKELDLGSNDELFWLWFRQNPQPALFFCRHDQYAMSNARQIMPAEPSWLLEAVGLVHIDTSQPIEGPSSVGSQRVQIRSRQSSTLGELSKVTVINAWDGTVLEQHLYDPQGQLIASARNARYQRDPVSGANLPRSTDLQFPTAQLSLHIDVTSWLVNTIPPDNLALWTKPVYPGSPDVDLADPNLRFAVPGMPPSGAPVPAAGLPMPRR